METADIIKFYRAINKIKHTERKGWKDIGIKGTIDTIASHSYGASMIGWLRAKQEGMDETKTIKLLLIHDLIMAYIEDLTPEMTNYKNKRELENKAAKKLFAVIPAKMKQEFKSLFFEYQEEKSEEAIFARECDKLDTLLQSLMYSENLGKNHTKRFLASFKHKFKSESGKRIVKEIEKLT